MPTEKLWSRDSFRRAAIRHYLNCQYIFRLIPSISNANYRNHVVSDCYYIGGYVMECALKYYVMNKLHLTRSYNKSNLDYQKLLTHDLHKLVVMATEGSETLDVEWRQLSKLTKGWSEEVRYDSSLSNSETAAVVGPFKKDLEKIFVTVFNEY